MAEREMTGIEALEELINMIPKEKHINSIHNNKIDILKYNVLKFLDKLEQLEKKYQKLEITFRKRAELCSEFGEYNRQYEKVLDFLMDKFKLELKGNRLYFLYNNQYFELDKEQEKLMKEALGYE